MHTPTPFILAVFAAVGCGKSGPAEPYGDWYADHYMFNGADVEMPDEDGSANVKMTIGSDGTGTYDFYRFLVTEKGSATVTETDDVSTHELIGVFDAGSQDFTFELVALGEQWSCEVDHGWLECDEMLGEDERIMTFADGFVPL